MATKLINKKWSEFSLFEKAAVIGGVGITAYAAYQLFTKDNVKDAPVDFGQIPQVYTSGGKPVLWNPDPLAKEIFENFVG